MKLNDPELEQNSCWQQAKPYYDAPQILKRKSPIRVLTCRDCGQEPRHQAESQRPQRTYNLPTTNTITTTVGGERDSLVVRAPDS